MSRYDRLMKRADKNSEKAAKARSKGNFKRAERKSDKARKLRNKARGTGCASGYRPVRDRRGRVTGCAVNKPKRRRRRR
jgi:hypothetical protein